MEENILTKVETAEQIEEIAKANPSTLKNVMLGLGIGAGICGGVKLLNWGIHCIKNNIAKAKAEKAESNKEKASKPDDEDFDISQPIDAE